MNLAFYTCFYGSDNNSAFKIPDIPSLTHDCYYYTNNAKILNLIKKTKWIEIYDNKQVNDDPIESCMEAKHVKVLPHMYEELKHYEYLCFMDSKLGRINEKFIEGIINDFFIEQNFALLLREHWFIHNSVWDEYYESMKQNRYKCESDKYIKYINNQIDAGLKDNTINHCACGLLIRNMKHEKIVDINETWYDHIRECGIQDQISFFFVKQMFEGNVHSFEDIPFV